MSSRSRSRLDLWKIVHSFRNEFFTCLFKIQNVQVIQNDVIKCCKMMSSNVAKWCHHIATSQQRGEIVFHVVIFVCGGWTAYWMGLWTFITIDPDLTAICSAQSRSLMFQLHPLLPAKATKLANGFSLYVFNYKVLCIYANQHFQARLLNTNCRACWVPTGAAKCEWRWTIQ